MTSAAAAPALPDLDWTADDDAAVTYLRALAADAVATFDMTEEEVAQYFGGIIGN